ncbi:hypothetical protein P152DRAFT_447195 [Eremomyces bilateralis CBS 781.70]|uniref:Uncharacterized protein n=1 Tax=Eremomyces bilateralis CBS 781.70 TaxID=1392243 RepID=A0A6G1G9Z9_9PEZI|nr:uncharacterized protein P152DRAFT_447195 [Eremomyces bilateralis CBS 781.70]KAF1814907.1 hypothetical protein P152DRAFT_447195 [Eremomyces bilateralis CBS 781.70]
MNTPASTSPPKGIIRSHKRTHSNISIASSPRKEQFPRPILRRRILSPPTDSETDSETDASSLPSPSMSSEPSTSAESASLSTGKDSSHGTHITDVDSSSGLTDSASESPSETDYEEFEKAPKPAPAKKWLDGTLSDSLSDSDSDTDSDSGSDESSVISVVPRDRRPRMRLDEAALAAGDSGQVVPLSVRLREFLPQLAAANQALETDRKAGNVSALSMESDFEDGVQYIEMDLGLGVLEERDPDMTSSSSESSDDEDDVADDAPTEPRYKENAMEKLMGQKPAAAGPKIEEV